MAENMDVTEGVTKLLSSPPVIPDYSSKFSRRAQFMKPQVMRIPKGFDDKSMILSGGQPNAVLNPVTNIDFQTMNGETVSVDPASVQTFGWYNQSSGFPQLMKWVMETQRREHQPPSMTNPDHPSGFGLTMTCGITQALHTCMTIFLENDGSETVLMEDVSYVSIIGHLRSHEVNIQGLDFDDDGLLPEALEDTLANWAVRHPGKRFPKLLYTITSANNPLGSNWSLERMLAIYAICRKYDLLILDDGAYFFIHFGKKYRSFQSLDIDGRVIRFDTFSKIIGAGYRVGWVSGPTEIMDKIIMNAELTIVHPSMASQVFIYEILKNWGDEGFQERSKSVSAFYRKQAECVLDACNKYLTGLASWTEPKGGMFIWIRIKDIPDSSDLVDNLETNNVYVVNGRFFQTDNQPNNCIRISYSLAPQDKLTKAIECIGECIRKELADQKKKQNQG